MDWKKYILKLREKHSLTQEKLAQLLGLSKATIQNWERGANAPFESQKELLKTGIEAILKEELK